MPMGPAPLGFAYFVGIKFAGYTAAAYALKRAYSKPGAGIWKVGAARTAIGIGAGLVYGGLWFAALTKLVDYRYSEYVYFAGLFPVRILEWCLVLHLFFDRALTDRQKAFRVSAGATIWSYCLDAIGIGAALVIPGGIWVC